MQTITNPAGTLPGFHNLTSASDLAQALGVYREQLAARANDIGGLEMMKAYSDLTDSLVCRVYEVALAEAERVCPSSRKAATSHIAIAAVGGYGRCEMAPFSDVDVRVYYRRRR